MGHRTKAITKQKHDSGLEMEGCLRDSERGGRNECDDKVLCASLKFSKVELIV